MSQQETTNEVNMKVKGNERTMVLTSIAELDNQFKKFFNDINNLLSLFNINMTIFI